MSPRQWWTVFILIGVAVVLIVWDIYVAITQPRATMSSILLHWAQRHPVVPFMFGALMGHLFWPQGTKVP